MPKSPLLGVEDEKKVIPAEDAEDVSEETDESEDEESEEDEDLEDSEEEEEVKPKKRAPRVNSMANTGTLGEARIDTSVPLSTNARKYMNALLKSPLIPAIVPPDMLNEASEHTLCINSLRIIVPKGRIFQAPMLLAQEIAQSFKNRV